MTELEAGKVSVNGNGLSVEYSERSVVRPTVSNLKYYIHDSIDSFRLQFFGVLSESDIHELRGCWQTAKTTLGGRKLVLDLRGLKGTDEPGKQWLLAMALEGATYLPDSYFRTGLGNGQFVQEAPVQRKLGILSRLISLFRSSRELPVESSTQAR